VLYILRLIKQESILGHLKKREIEDLAKVDYQAGKRVNPALLPTKVSPLYERALRHSPDNPFLA